MLQHPFFALLRLSLGNRESSIPVLSEAQWESLYATAKSHAIVGTLFAAVERLASTQRPPRKLLLEWFSTTERIRQTNNRLNREAVRLTDAFTAQGWPCVILKGQGVARLYDEPLLRQSGDIDIYVRAPREEVTAYLRQHSQTPLLESLKDIGCSFAKDIAVEVHLLPAVMTCPWANRRWLRFVAAQGDALFNNAVELPDGVGRINVPTPLFDAVFLPLHIYRHLFYEGIGLRQIIDYHYLLRSEHLTVDDRREAADTLRRLGLDRFLRALSWVQREALGLSEELLSAEPNEYEGRFLLREIMQGGNFGRDMKGVILPGCRFNRFFAVVRANTHMLTHYPREVFFNPLFTLHQYVWRKRRGFV